MAYPMSLQCLSSLLTRDSTHSLPKASSASVNESAEGCLMCEKAWLARASRPMLDLKRPTGHNTPQHSTAQHITLVHGILVLRPWAATKLTKGGAALCTVVQHAGRQVVQGNGKLCRNVMTACHATQHANLQVCGHLPRWCDPPISMLRRPAATAATRQRLKRAQDMHCQEGDETTGRQTCAPASSCKDRPCRLSTSAGVIDSRSRFVL